jgi:hypothetical protein
MSIGRISTHGTVRRGPINSGQDAEGSALSAATFRPIHDCMRRFAPALASDMTFDSCH